MARSTHLRLHVGYRSHVVQRCSVGIALGLVGFVGCSLQSFDDLTRGESEKAATGGSAGVGGTVPHAGSGNTGTDTGASGVGAQSGSVGGASGVAATAAGGASTGGAGSSGVAPGTAGRVSTAGATGSSVAAGGRGGATATGGSGGRTSVAVAGASGAAPCPAFTGVGGTMIVPPATDFETAPDVPWVTTSSLVSSVYRVEGPGSACDGSWYLKCDPAIVARQAGWDGPAVELLSYVTPGHKYLVSLAARFDPQNAPKSPKNIGFTLSKSCSDSTITQTFSSLLRKTTQTAWVRLDGQFAADMPGCALMSRLVLYVETDDTEKAFAINVDSFFLVDVTQPISGAGGAGGGGAGAGGASGGAGAGGASGGGGAAVGTAGLAGAAGLDGSAP